MSLLRSSLIILSLTMFSSFDSQAGSVFSEKPVMDFGVLSVAQVIKKKNLDTVFKIENKSSHVLKIDKIATSCGCTSVKPDKIEIKPGDTLNLNVDIKLEGKSGKNKVQIIITFNDGTMVPLELNYDVSIDAAIFPTELYIAKKNGKSAGANITAYFSFSSPIAVEKLPEIKLVSKNPAITFHKKNVRIQKTPNELNGHYYCIIDFEASVDPRAQEIISSCILTQDGDPIRSIPIIVSEKKDVTLRRSSFILGKVVQGEIVPIHLEVEGLTSAQNPSLTIDGLADGDLKVTRCQDGEIVSFDWSSDQLGFSSRQGTLILGGYTKLPFSCIANVVPK